MAALNHKHPFAYLAEPVLTEGERQLVLLNMARTAYGTWCELGEIRPEWDALPTAEKQRWGETVRMAVRAMFNIG